jgi:hypothetical protein
MTFELAPRHRITLHALGEALFSHDGGPEPAQLDRVVRGMELHLAPISWPQRAMLLFALDLVRWLPLVLWMAWAPFEALPVDRRLRVLERMDRSSVAMLLVPLVAYKSLLSMHFFEEEAELRAMGYSGPERTRWRKILV